MNTMIDNLRELFRPMPRPVGAPRRRLHLVPGIGIIAICGMLSGCREERAGAQALAAHAGNRTGLLEATIRIDGRDRRFGYYIPERLASPPPFILAFHGSGGGGERLRGFMGGELERLAEERGFIPVYPEGLEGNWNGCRALAPSSANRLGIDDVGFVRALVARLTRELGTDPERVSALGFSGGGHMAYRLALEIPEQIPAVAVLGASLPVAEELDCRPSGRPVSIMIVNGSADPVNPYGGGEVVAPGGTRLGRVRSTRATAEYFADLHGYGVQSTTSLTRTRERDGGTWVEETMWFGASGAFVNLVTIHGGGHTIPGPRSRLPEIVGATERRFHAVREAVSFLLGPQSGLLTER